MIYFGERLQIMRKKCKLTQAELAYKAGISTSAVGMYEQNRRRPNFQILKRICDILSVQVDYLLGEEESKNTVDIYKISYNFINTLNKSNLQIGGKTLDKNTSKEVREIMKGAVKRGMIKIYQLIL